MPADDDDASGPPPHPLDRVWFHPSELGSPVGALRPQPVTPRLWVIAAIALLTGIAGTLGVVSMIGAFDGTSSSRLQRTAPSVTVGSDVVADLVAAAGPSIVKISVVPAGGGEATLAGSGVVFSPSRIVTAGHLVENRGGITVATIGGQVMPAQLVGVDPETDLALLTVENADLIPAFLPTGEVLRIGQTVAALASGPTRPWVSAGVISAVNRVGPLVGGTLGTALIETDARLNENGTAAGGGLFNSSGGVIGILTGSGHFAIPIDVARDVVQQLAASGRAAHGWLGLTGTDVVDRPGGGVRVRSLVPGNAAEAGKLQVDDVIVTVGDTGVGSMGDLVASLRRLRPGDPVEIGVIRDGKRIRVPVTLGASVTIPADWQVVA